jgi:transmembrane sensor
MTMEEKNDGATSCHEAAAEWLVRLQESDLPAEEWLRWQRWLDENSRNREAFDEMVRTSQRTDARRSDLFDIPMPSQSEREADAYVGEGAVSEWLGKANSTAAQEKEAVGARSYWPRRFAMAAGIAVVAVAAGILLRANVFETDAPGQLQSYETVESEHRDITLSDGTAITLGAKSSLAVNYSRERRTVILEDGEALFTVAKDPDRPFVVVAGSGTITAIGTAFNVRRDHDRVVVTVTEGEIEIKRRAGKGTSIESVQTSSSKRTSATLSKGHQVVYDASQLNIVEIADPSAATAWRVGRLQYRAEPLKFVINGVNRYSAKEIIIADRQVEEMQFTGSVFQDQADDWLDGLEQVFPIEVIEMGDDKVLLRQRASQSP